ncbi:MAG TPA: metallophosphoesterase family protein [Bacteroidales bacterium]|nr:metallophosphoesterase family protein [Bacteroidales bacterium]
MRYCIGDIHGCIKTLEKLVRVIYTLDKNPKLYFAGDYIDRGPDSKAVLDFLMDAMQSGLAVQLVRGNHEDFLIKAYLKKQAVLDSDWIYNGGEQTIKSFNPDASINSNVCKYIPENYFGFLHALPFYIELEDYWVAHAGFNFNIQNPLTDKEYMLWTREENYNAEKCRYKKIIHGHTPGLIAEIKQKTLSSPVINVDTGCVYAKRTGLGILTAFNLDTQEFISVKNQDIS